MVHRCVFFLGGGVGGKMWKLYVVLVRIIDGLLHKDSFIFESKIIGYCVLLTS